ncbi:MAG: NAD(P)-binding domain-containing protein [Ignavibacteria bacterium]|nr:NAD(P)-binding domain-containing protein [Ignavibacteria bacterium]
MKIGIIGAGHIGGTVAKLCANAGHQVCISNSRGPESLAELLKELGPNVQASTVNGAAAFGEIVLLAAPWRTLEALPSPSVISGKIVIDAMNPYAPDGSVYELRDITATEKTASRLPGARVVKAFNTIWSENLRTLGTPEEDKRITIFVAGDDADAKATVAQLIGDMGFAALDTGTLRVGGLRQAVGSPLYNTAMTLEQAKAALASMP